MVPQKEQELKSKSDLALQEAKEIIIKTEQDLKVAASLMEGFKTAKKAVEEFFQPIKSQAHKAWKEIVAKEKSILEPYVNADKEIKKKVNEYHAEQERMRREKERELQKRQQQEMERLLEEAAKTGDEALLDTAIMTETLKPVVHGAPKVKGITMATVLKITVEDEAKVPAYVNGICIRPVEEKAVKELVRLKKDIEIPGIKIEWIKEARSR